MAKFSDNSGEGQESTRGLLDGIEAVTVDLFDTLVQVDMGQLPRMTFGGTTIHSTAPIVFDAMRELLPDLEFERFYLDYSHITEQFWEEKNEEDIELPAPVRMQRVLNHFRALPEDEVEAHAERLAAVHMKEFTSKVELIDGAVEMLTRLRARNLPIALVSNFDYAPAVHDLIERLGIARFFDTRVISHEVGLRKPHRGIFDHALARLETRADAVLHIGDDARADAWGAGRLGFRTIWIDRKGEGFPEPEHYPRELVTRLDEIVDLLD